MKVRNTFFLLILFATLSFSAYAKTIYIRVDRLSQNPFPIAVLATAGDDPQHLNFDIDILLKRDLDFTDYFKIIPPETYITEKPGPGFETGSINFSNWLAIDALALVKTSYQLSGNTVTLKGALYDTLREKRLLLFEGSESRANVATLIDRFVDAMLEELTGEPGIFSTRIAFIHRDELLRHHLKTISVFGKDEMTIFTSPREFMLSPQWGASGKSIYFTKDTLEKAQVFEIQLKSRRLTRLPTLDGTVLSPAVCRTGGRLAISVTTETESEIRLIDAGGRLIRLLASSPRLNISPSFSPDCKMIVFSSGKSGGLHVFTQPTDEVIATRRTFQGDLNDTPAWSPRGDKILFSGMDRDGQFDIFAMTPDGEDLTRLTYDSRNNESPSWSPDGRHIIFSSNRTGHYQLWIMKADGTNQRQLTFYTNGRAITPSWSPRLSE